MKIIGTMIARNEAWVLPASIPAALQWCDEVWLLMHTSSIHEKTDDTILLGEQFSHDYAGRFHFDIVTTPEWDEALIRGIALAKAREREATHIAIIDADEVLTAPSMGNIKTAAGCLAPGDLLRLPWIHCWRSLDQYRCDDSPFGRARVPFLFAAAPHLSYSPDKDGYQLHKRFPRGVHVMETWEHDAGLGVLHMQHARWERVVAKQLLYAETERRRWGKVRANYRDAVDETGLITRPIPAEWWPVDRSLVDLKAEAWQEAAMREVVAR